MTQGGVNDKYNLWYLLFCAAVAQPEYNKKGQLKADVFDDGHGGWRLADFTAAINERLQQLNKSRNRVTDAGILALRLYSVSTYAPMNTALRATGAALQAGNCAPELKLRACIQSARKCLLQMAAIPRPREDTYRGVTGFLGSEFESSELGMDFAFSSATTDRTIAAKFAGSAAKSVLFEIKFIRACPGVDISMISVYPGQKEVLFPPCTSLSLTDPTRGGKIAGASAGQVCIRVTPTVALPEPR
jgi:hypothetical protein